MIERGSHPRRRQRQDGRVPIASRLPINHIIDRAHRIQAGSPAMIDNIGEAIIIAILYHFRNEEVLEVELVEAYKNVIRTMYPLQQGC